MCGANEWTSGHCGGTVDNVTCNVCSHMVCGVLQQRHGVCNGTTNGFTCTASTGTLSMAGSILGSIVFLCVVVSITHRVCRKSDNASVADAGGHNSEIALLLVRGNPTDVQTGPDGDKAIGEDNENNARFVGSK